MIGVFAPSLPLVPGTYTSGLIAPSVIGGIAQGTNLTVSFIVVTLLASGLAILSGVLRPQSGSRSAGARAGS